MQSPYIVLMNKICIDHDAFHVVEWGAFYFSYTYIQYLEHFINECITEIL